MAKCQFFLNQLDKAEEYLTLAEKEYELFFHSSEKHIDQAALHTVKGNIFMKKGQYQSAKEAFLKSLHMYAKILSGNSHFDERGMLYESLVDVYNHLDQKGEAIKYYYLHEKEFGKQHPRTLRIKKNVILAG